MSQQIANSRVAARLLQALEPSDTLTCEQAQTQIPALVEAEFAGVNVEREQEFVELLRHLDHCADCIALYVKLAEDMEAIVGESETLPQISFAAPSSLVPQRQSETVILRVLGALKRRFELALIPQLPAPATLGASERLNIFADYLQEVRGKPFVAVTLVRGAADAELIVVVRDVAGERWQVELESGGIRRSATTGEQGIARFSGIPVDDVQSLKLFCTELVAEQQDN